MTGHQIKETEMLMKNAIKRTVTALGVLALVGAGVGLASGADSGSASFIWKFNSNADPAAPEVSPGGTASPVAVVQPGAFASGWMTNNPLLGSATGVWDLGQNGTITLSNAVGLAKGGSPPAVVSIKVVQFQDGALYSQLATVSVPGATQVSSSVSVASDTGYGSWMVTQSDWSVPAGTTVSSATVSGTTDGTLVDQVALSTSSVVSPPLQLTIQRLGNGSQVQISWSAASGAVTLESRSALGDSAGWSAVQPQPQVQTSGTTAYVVLDATNAVGLYRLKQ